MCICSLQFFSVFDEVMDYFVTFLHGNDTEKYAGFVVICSKVKNVSKHSVHSPFFFNFFLPRTKTYAKLQRQNKKLKAPFKIIYKLDVRECNNSFKIHEQIMQQGSFVKVLPLLFLTYELYSMCQNNDECIYDIKINKKSVPKFVGFFVNFFGSKLSFNKAVSMVVSWSEGFFVRVATRYASSPIVF